STERNAKVVAAARAAASWARARRATWTSAPPPVYVPSPEEIARAAAMEAARPAPLDVPTGPSAATRMAEGLQEASGAAIKWVVRLAIAAALIGGAVLGYPYVAQMLKSKPAPPAGAGAANPGR